jgi:uncharacterized protein
MQFNVAQLLKEPTGGTRKYDVQESPEDLELDPELVIQEPIAGRVKFTKIPRGILVNGSLQTVLEVNCTRCLDPFDLPVAIEIEEQFHPTVDLQTGATLPHDEDVDEATLISERNIIDLSEVVRQALLLELPATAVCREACLGMCPHCGQNLNEGPCNCPAESYDPRWESLKALLERSDEDQPES